jgi:hypothetical protein
MLSKYGVFSDTLGFPSKKDKTALTQVWILGKVDNRTSVSPQANCVHTQFNTQYPENPKRKGGWIAALRMQAEAACA